MGAAALCWVFACAVPVPGTYHLPSRLRGFLLFSLQLPILWLKGWDMFGWAKSRDQLEQQ